MSLCSCSLAVPSAGAKAAAWGADRQVVAHAAPQNAALSPPLRLTPFAIEFKPHLVATLGLYGVLALSEGTVKPLLVDHFNCQLQAGGQRCDASQLWTLDKSVVGHDSRPWRRVSDWGNLIGLGGVAIAAVADSLTSPSGAPLADAATDVLVLAETVGVAALATHVLKFAIRRPRPALYRDLRLGVENDLSFPSGHTSAVAASSTAYATLFALRHGSGMARYAVAAAGVGVTALTAYGRVAGGMHFYTDVFAGALVGAAIGYALPHYYRRGWRLELAGNAPRPIPTGRASSAHFSASLSIPLEF